jgi:hypothetical protein
MKTPVYSYTIKKKAAAIPVARHAKVPALKMIPSGSESQML